MCPPLSAIRDLFARHLFHAHFEPVSADLDVFLFHFLLCLCGDIVCDRVGNVANEAGNADDDKED